MDIKGNSDDNSSIKWLLVELNPLLRFHKQIMLGSDNANSD